MSKAKIKQALRKMQIHKDYSVEILQKAEESEIDFEAMLIAKKAYKSEIAKKKRYDHNLNKTNPSSNIQ